MSLDQIENFLSFLNKIEGLPAAALVFVFCLAVGYAWRGLQLKWFPNDAIPLVVMLTGALAMMFIADGRPTTMPHHVWTARNLFVGFIIGGIAWAVHNYAISKLEEWLVSKFPSLSNTSFFTKPPDAPKQNQVDPNQKQP